MRLFPDARLLAGLCGWTLLAALAVLLPALLPLLVGAGLLLLGLVVWDAKLLAGCPPLAVERLLPERVFAGRTAEIVLRIANAHGVSREVIVVDELPSDVAEPEPRFDGVRVPARDEVRLVCPIRPQVRGDRELGPVLLLERSPLGLLRRRSRSDAGAILQVHPDTSRLLQRESLDARRLIALLGARPARRRGDGLEFESLRDFVPGDDPRRLDWAASARRGRAVLRLYEHEQHHTIVLAVDRSRLMGGRAGRSGLRTKLDFAVDAALALGLTSLAAGDRVGLVVFDGRVQCRLAPRRHRRSLGALADALRPVQPALLEADYEALARHLAVQQRERALVVVLTDFVEAAEASFAAPLTVLARRHRVLLVAIRDPLLEGLEPAQGRSGAHPIERRIVMDDLVRGREATLAGLRRRGVESLDLPPDRVTAGLLNRYLALREENW